MAPLIGARDRFTPWVACERSRMAPLIGARDRFTPWVACERSRMAPLELAALGVAEARERIGRGTLSPVALVEACLERIGALDATVQAWVHVDAKGALAAARLAEHAAVRGPLHGIPVAVKDIFDVAGLPTTAGAPPFAHRRPDEDAASVALLRAAGAIVLGKTHTTQFAYRDPAPTRNPWSLAHTPGGSSSGSAAAVAARMVPLALGSQTVGSVLRPAAYCGVVGFKPTHGLVPTAGVIPLAWSLDHVGVFTREVADAAAAFAVLARRSVAAQPCGPPRPAPTARGSPSARRSWSCSRPMTGCSHRRRPHRPPRGSRRRATPRCAHRGASPASPRSHCRAGSRRRGFRSPSSSSRLRGRRRDC